MHGEEGSVDRRPAEERCCPRRGKMVVEVTGGETEVTVLLSSSAEPCLEAA